MVGQPGNCSHGEAMPAICSLQLNWGELSFWGGGQEEELLRGPSGVGVSSGALSR